MAYYDQDWINGLLAKIDIEDIVSDYVSLQNKSGRMWGLCPFHHEKTPSFSVSKDKQIFYCFGCHEGGNVISFLMKIDKLTFPEAIERLAERAGIPLPENTSDADYEKNKQRRLKIYEINKKAGQFYYQNLTGENGKHALDYLKSRGLDDKTIKKFGLGYASDEWDSLLNHLTEQGYKKAQINEAGLCLIKNEHAYDNFRNRIMFPIFNVFGDVIGFGGRVMDDSTPKYLNTSDTFAFNKRRNVYALNFVKAIKRIQSVVLVEGYMDVISLYAKGIYNAVATLGTALTKEQALLIKRYVPLVYIAYDGDAAGQKATLKAIEILESVGLKAKVIVFSEGVDPDEYIKTNGYNAFVAQAKHALDAVNYRLDRLKEGHDLSAYEGKSAYVVGACEIIKSLQNPIEREQYIIRLGKETGHSLQAIKDQISSQITRHDAPDQDRFFKMTHQQEAGEKKIDPSELALAKIFLANPKKIAIYEIGRYLEYIQDSRVKNILNVINTRVKEGILPTDAELLTELDNEAQKLAGSILTKIDVEDVDGLDVGHILDNYENKILTYQRDELLKKIASSTNKDMILAEISELNKKLHDKKKKPN